MILAKRIGLCVRILFNDKNQKREEWLAIEIPEDKELRKYIEEALIVLSTQGHSGGSMVVLLPLLIRAIQMKPLSPLTGEESEWNDVSEFSGRVLYQNRRCPSVFKDESGAWDIDGTYYIDRGGAAFSNRYSAKRITFPYMPAEVNYIKYRWYVSLWHKVKDYFVR